MSSIASAPTISGEICDRMMLQYIDLIYRVTGIRIPAVKKTLMSNRIRRRLKATGMDSYEQYFNRLCGLDARHDEWDAFLQEITTHETYLFRDQAQWQWFREEYLPAVAELARQGERDRTLRIWSAAASTGDEAYTIACCIAASLPHFAQWKISIVGTDIGSSSLEQARTACYGQRAMKLVPADLKQRYFEQLPAEDSWQAKQSLRRMVRFQTHNLLMPLGEEPFDLVFLKNVLIYFDQNSKQTVIANVRSALADEGHLISGPAEGISNLLGDMQRLKPWLFRKSS